MLIELPVTRLISVHNTNLSRLAPAPQTAQSREGCLCREHEKAEARDDVLHGSSLGRPERPPQR